MEQNQNGKESQKIIQYKEKNIKRGLPKNIRQIGEVTGKQKIYIEDYVVTYLNQLAHPTNSIARGAILLGEWVRYEKEEVLFISGAVEADNLSFDMNEVTFSGDTWTDIYEKVSKYFEDINVVGWFLSRLGYSVKLTDTMSKLHRKHFKESGSVLYLMDALEQEDAFYLLKGDQLSKQTGYYIYYERNTPMQNYLIENQALERNSTSDKRIEYKDGQLLHNYHEIMAGRREHKEEKRITSMLYVTSALLVIVFLALSISIFNNYDKLRTMQTSLDHMVAKGTDTTDTQDVTLNLAGEDTSSIANADTAAMAENGPGDTQVGKNATAPEESLDANGNDNADNSANGSEGSGTEAETGDASTQLPASDTQETATAHADASSQTTQDSVAAASLGNRNYYTVQPGDTLLSISQQIYHSADYVETICNANEIGENDYIYPGQQIVIPTIQ